MSAPTPAPAANPAPAPSSAAGRVVRCGPARIVVTGRTAVVAGLLATLALIAFLAALALGEPVLPLGRLFEVLAGGGARADRILVLDLRANRAIVAALAGAALGISGAIMQSVTRNPLASPDILGITAGASAGAVIVIVSMHGSLDHNGWAAPVGAILGGLTIATVIALFSAGLDPLRMVLAGIALSALCTALISFLLTVVDLQVAASAYTWLAGSLNGRGTEHIWPVAGALVVAVIVLVPLSRRAALLSLGTLRAQTLGVPVAHTERVLLLISVLLASMATAATGPIGFVAFVAPQITARLARTASPPLLTSAFTGAILVLSADTLTRAVLSWSAPIGAVTSALGAPVLIYFLWKAVRV